MDFVGLCIWEKFCFKFNFEFNEKNQNTVY